MCRRRLQIFQILAERCGASMRRSVCRRLQTGRKPIPESSPYELERIGRCDDFRHCTHYPQRMVGRTKRSTGRN